MKFKSDVDVEAALAVSGNVEIGSSGQTTLNQTSTHFFMDMTSSTSYFRNTSTAGGGFIFRNSGIGDFEFDNEFAGNIKFNTSNSERMRINSAGNVGIGTTSPSGRLDVIGGVLYTNNDIRIGNDFGATGTGLIKSISGVLSMFTWGDSTNIQIGGADVIFKPESGTERMRIESDGIISIGEGATQSWIANKVQTTTTAVLGKQDMSDIDRTTANWMRITNPVYSTNGSVGLIMRTFPNSDARQGAGIIASGGSDNAATDLDLFVSRQTSGATTSTSYSALSIKGNTGKVGIGTTSPDYLLDLYRSTGTTGSTTGTTLQRLWNYVGSDLQQQKTFVDFVFQDDNDNEYPQVRIGAEVGQNGNADTQEKEGSGAFVVYTNNATGTTPGTPTGLAERFRVDYQGNVGIGTTNPSAKLHIEDTSGANIILNSATGAVKSGIYLTEGTSSTPAQVGAYLSYDGSSNKFSIATGLGVPADKLTIARDTGLLQLNSYGAGTLVSDASGNITVSSGGGAGGPYLPLAGGTLTGALTGTAATFAGNVVTGAVLSITGTATGSPYIQLIQGGTQRAYLQYADTGDNLVLQSDGQTTFKTGGNIDALNLDASQNAIFAGTIQSDDITIVDGTNDVNLNFGNTSYGLRLDYSTGDIFLRTNGAARLTVANGGNATFTGTVTSPTFIGDLNGTINTVTTAVTKANATNDTTVATTAFVQNLIGTIPAGLVFQGTWNAATNTPTLTSGSGTTGHFYIVSTSGSTNLDGVTDWVTGDWAVFIEQGGTDAWEKIDNSSVLDGAGTGQTVALWSGSGTSNTLTDAPITVSGNNTTFAGNIMSTQGGTAALPKITLSASTTTGIYTPAANGWGVSTDGVSRLVIDSTGDVFTLEKLAVAGTNSPQKRFVINNSQGEGIQFNYDNSNNYRSQILNYWNSNADTRMDFNIARTSGQAPETIMSVGYGGNVGIGTTAPGAKLEVETSGTNSVIITDNSDTQYSLIQHNALGVTKGFTGYNSGFMIYGGESGVTTRLQAGGAYAATILTNGNVGIGTTNPVTKLEVDRDLQSDTINRANSAAYIRGQDIGLAIGQYASGPYGTWIQSISNTDATFPLTLNGLGGNVGIGTASPVAKLHIQEGNSNILIGSDDTYGQNYSAIGFGGLSNGSNRIFAGYDGSSIYDDMYYAAGTGKGHQFRVNGAGSTSMIINSSGNVGIGTTGPTRKLQVDSATGYALSLNSTQQYLMEFARNGVSEWWFAVNNGDFKFHENGAGDQVIVKAGGSVGIGATNPQSKLQVDGGIQMADDSATAAAAKVGTMRYRTGTEYVEVSGTELVINGDFAADTDWNKNANWTISGGTANADGTANSDMNQDDNLPVVGKSYKISYEITASTQGQIRIAYGGVITPYASAIGKYEFAAAATSTDRIRAQSSGNFTGSIDNVSIVEVTSEDASYADMCMQTGSSTYEWVNIVRNTY